MAAPTETRRRPNDRSCEPCARPRVGAAQLMRPTRGASLSEPRSALSAAAVFALSSIACGLLPATARAADPIDAISAASGLGPDFTLLLIYVLVALFFSFLCSVAEAVLLSITPSFIAELREREPQLAARLQRIKTGTCQ
jgi:MFS family permease